VGEAAPFARTLTKRLLAPLGGEGAQGRRRGLVCFGVGSTECFGTAQRAAQSGQHVVMVCAYRHGADVLFLGELCALAAQPGAGRFELHVLLSREAPDGQLLARVSSALAAAGVADGALPASIHLRQGRVDAAQLRGVFSPWLSSGKDGAASPPAPAFLAVGSKAQQREAHRLLHGLGLRGRLLGRPVSILPALGLAP
jgi:hypothetical protein